MTNWTWAMLFALIDRFLEPFSPVLMRPIGETGSCDMPTQPTTDLLVRNYYRNALPSGARSRVEEEECS